MARKDSSHKEEVMFMHHKDEYRTLSQVQQHSINYCLPAILSASKSLAETQDCQPLTVVDYGAADGFNSLPLIKACAGELQGNKFMKWIFNDLPIFDFKVPHRKLEAVLKDKPAACPIYLHYTPGNFFKQVFPTETVDLGICAHALHWLSHRPPKNCNLLPYQPDDITKTILAQDWEDFLLNRSIELKPGGRLVLLLNSTTSVNTFHEQQDLPNANQGFVHLIQETIQDMLDTFIITEEEYQLVRALPFSFRAEDELRAPFRAGSRMNGILNLKQLITYDIPDMSYQGWIENGGKSNESATKEYATGIVNFLKSFCDVIFEVLRATKDKEGHQRILKLFYEKAECITEKNPARFRPDLKMTVLEIIKP